MQAYKNLGGNSGVKEFSIGEDYIDVKFFGSKPPYRYSYKSAGSAKVEEMKKLAINGVGLNSYILRNAKDDFEK